MAYGYCKMSKPIGYLYIIELNEMITSQSNTFSQRSSPRFTGVVISHNPYSRETGDKFLDQNQPRSIVHFDIFTDQFIKSKVQYDNQKLASKIATEWDNILKDWPPSPISDKNLWDKSDSYFKDRCKILINESRMPCKQKQISLHVLD
jgi:hypothetical protein